MFLEAKENAWFELQNIFKNLRKTEYIGFQEDLKEFKQQAFIFKVLEASPEYSDEIKRKAALDRLRNEFKEQFPKCEEYQK